MTALSYVLDIRDPACEDNEVVGDVASRLAKLARLGYPMLPGFVVQNNAYYDFLKYNNLLTRISGILDEAAHCDESTRIKLYTSIKKHIIESEFPKAITKELFIAYKNLGGTLKQQSLLISASVIQPANGINQSVSAKYATHGEANMMLTIKELWASIYSPVAISWRQQHKLEIFDIGICVVVQKMVHADRSGILETSSPRDKRSLVIEAVYGLSDYISSGKVSPDHYTIDKATLQITNQRVNTQSKALHLRDMTLKEEAVDHKYQNLQKLSDSEIQQLALLGKNLEQELYFPQEVMWSYEKQSLHITSIDPMSIVPRKNDHNHDMTERMPILIGTPITQGIATGTVKIITNATKAILVGPSDVVVLPYFESKTLKQYKQAAAIITDQGGITSDAAMVAADIGIPIIVGTQVATKNLKNGTIITVNASKGEIYEGGYSMSQAKSATATKLYIYVTNPLEATSLSTEHIDGVGVIPGDGLIQSLGIHPKKLLREGKSEKYIQHIIQQLGALCEYFSPRKVIYRLSDLSTFEYRKLTGGLQYDIRELNPLLGYHGAFRHIHDQEVLAMELKAIKLLRDERKIKNLSLMLPFVRSVTELKDIKQAIANAGIYRTPTLQIWMSIDTPQVALYPERYFKQGIDGVAINANRLSSLLTGTDTHNPEMLPFISSYDESLIHVVHQLILTCLRHNMPVQLYASTHMKSDLIELAIKAGVSMITVIPEAITPTKELIIQTEKNIVKRAK